MTQDSINRGLILNTGQYLDPATTAEKWLRHWDFYRQTGLPVEHVRFCLQRPEKAIHCKQLKLTYFIDDRLDVLEHLRGLVPNLYLFGEQPKLDNIPGWVKSVETWEDAVRSIKGKIAA